MQPGNPGGGTVRYPGGVVSLRQGDYKIRDRRIRKKGMDKKDTMYR